MKHLLSFCRYLFLSKKSLHAQQVKFCNEFFRQQNTDYHHDTSGDNNTEVSEETQKFSSLSFEWWDINGPMKSLHSMNEVRVPFIRDCLMYEGYGDSKASLSKPLKDIDILDIGCGGGILSEPLARLGANVVGIDSSDDLIQVAKSHRPSEFKNLQYLAALAEDIVSVGSLKFDAVVASEVIEHVATPSSFVQTCSNLLKPKGSLVISTINRTTLSNMLAINFAEQILKVVPQGSHDWYKFVKPNELSEYLHSCKCSIRKIHGLSYNPFCDSWAFTNATDMNYIVHAVKQDLEGIANEDNQTN